MVSEEMIEAGRKTAWQDHGVVLDSDEARAIYLAMSQASPIEDGLVERLRYWEGDGHPHGLLHREAADRIISQSRSIRVMRAEILRLVDALHYAHSEGFEWPTDPLPFGSIAHDLFIERGNDPERIAARSALGASGE